MAMAKMYTCTYKHHGIIHCKYVLPCCDKVPFIVLPSQEENKYTTNTCPTIIFCVYRNVSCCTVHVRHPLKNVQHVSCVTQFQGLTGLTNYTRKKTFVTRNNNNRIP